MRELWPLRSLSELMYKTVKITCIDGREVFGEADGFCDAFELEEQQELITIRTAGGRTDGAFFDEIASVTVLDE